MGLNKVMIIGHVGQDPELRATASGSFVCSFSIAATEYFTGKDGNKTEKTEWIKVVAFGAKAETLGKWVTKGKQMYIEGKLSTRKYDGSDGQPRYITEVILNDFQFLGKNEKSAEAKYEDKKAAPNPPKTTASKTAGFKKTEKQKSPEEEINKEFEDETYTSNPDDIPF